MVMRYPCSVQAGRPSLLSQPLSLRTTFVAIIKQARTHASADHATTRRLGFGVGDRVEGPECDRRWGRPEKVGTAGTAAGRLGHRLVCGLGRGHMCVYAHAHAHAHVMYMHV